MLKNDSFIRALWRQPVERTPVWVMRQAGRYLPEFRELRARVPDFMSFCKIPELACEATLQPINRFDLDAAIIFSDILTIPCAMGVQLDITPNVGPIIHNPIGTLRDVEKLVIPDVQEALSYVMQAITLTRQALHNRVPLIGFAGSPWTVACYLIEGGGSKTFNKVRSLLYREPNVLHALLTKLTTVTVNYLNAQITAGAQAIMLFDTWGGLLGARTYREFSLNYMSSIAQGLDRITPTGNIPLIFFTKNGGQWLELIADSGCDAVGLDWTVDIGKARALVGHRVALQGNLDPAVLFAKPAQIRAAVKEIIEAYGPSSGHVFNLGHGIDPSTPPESMAVLVDAVHEFGLTRLE